MKLRSRPKRCAVGLAVTALAASGVALTTSSAGVAEAAPPPPPVSQAEGEFLHGSVGNTDLAKLVELKSAYAVNTGGPQVTVLHPLDITLLNALHIPLGNGIQLLDGNDWLHLGLVNQFAQADPTGASRAASGAVNNQGAIAIGSQNGFPPGNATLDLAKLIGPGLATTIADLDLAIGAVAAIATQGPGAHGPQDGDYAIADVDVRLNSPLIAGVIAGLKNTLVGLQPTLQSLIDTINGALGPIIEIEGIPDLGKLVDAITILKSPDGSVDVNLQTGIVNVDLTKLLTTLKLDLNNLPPGTELLTYVTKALTDQVLPGISALLKKLINAIVFELQHLKITLLGSAVVPLGPALNEAVAPLVNQLLDQVNQTLQDLNVDVITPLVKALTGLVSLKANIREFSAIPTAAGITALAPKAPGTFTQRALRLTLLPNSAPPLAVVDLASASVGPNFGPPPPPPCVGVNCPPPPCVGVNCPPPPCVGVNCPPPPCVGVNCPPPPCVGVNCPPPPCAGVNCPPPPCVVNCPPPPCAQGQTCPPPPPECGHGHQCPPPPNGCQGPICPADHETPVNMPDPTKGDGGLPSTGAKVLGVALAGLALVLMGTATVLASRRRRGLR